MVMTKRGDEVIDTCGEFVVSHQDYFFFKKRFLLFFLNFLYFRGRYKELVGEGQREEDRIPSRLHTVSAEPMWGLNS